MSGDSNYDFSMDDNFSEEFKKYVREKNLICQRLSTVFSGEESSSKAKRRWNKRALRKKQQQCFAEPKCIWVFRKLQQLDAETSAYNALIDTIVRVFGAVDACGEYVIKFWITEEVNKVDDFGQKRLLLTTRNQPFLIARSGDLLSDGICSYLMRMDDLEIDEGVGEGGVIGRVFRNKRMEFTPDVGYYSYEEYPHRDLALSCHIKFSLALPLFDSSGVIELVSTLDPRKSFATLSQREPESFITKLCRMFQRECLDCCSGQNGSGGNFLQNVAEIKDIMKVVGKSCDVVLGQTWILCELCNSLSTCEIFDKTLDASYRPYLGKNCCFLDVESMFNLQMEEGVVGKAASSPHNMVYYCEDISKFNITEYPLAHFAQLFDLSGCFAICLRASHLTGGQLYVLEFFTRYRSGYVDDSNLTATLVPVIEAMRQNFRTFSFYRIELEGKFSIQVIRINDVGAGRLYLLEGSIGEKTDFMKTYSSKDNSASSVESEFRAIIKACYGDDFIKFLLSDSSIDALREKVSQGLKLGNDAYIIKYQDDVKDWIRIECDQDVNEFIKDSPRSEGIYILSIELKDSS